MAALGGGHGDGYTGVAAVVSSGQAIPVVATYLLLFGTTGALVLRRRDVVYAQSGAQPASSSSGHHVAALPQLHRGASWAIDEITPWEPLTLLAGDAR